MDFLEGLNQAQRAAVTAGEGPTLILAGPGSGKTRVLTHRVAYLIKQLAIKPYHIMAVTFTNKAAKEMRHRIESTLGERQNGLQIGTFHAMCARLLRIEVEHTPYDEDFVIYDTDDQLSAISQAMGELKVDPKRISARRILGIISNAKNEMITAAKFVSTDYVTEKVSRVYMRYQDILLDSNALDFDDLLLQTLIMLQEHDEIREKYAERYYHVLVDEFQDTNQVQYELVKLFGAPQNNIFAVGDEDQSIYAFRGADYRNVLRFAKEYPDHTKILLEQNYRSTQMILDAARSIIDQNSNRTPKALFTNRADNIPLSIQEAYNEDYEAKGIITQVEALRHEQGYHYHDIAVMYRTNAQSRAIEEMCVREGIPYTLVGGVGFYKRQEIRDLLAYLRVVHNPDDRMSFARIINVPRRGIGKKSLLDFQYWASQNNLSYADALQKLVDGEPTTLSPRAAKKFAEFGTMLQRWQEIAKTDDLFYLLDTIQEDVGYDRAYLEQISDRPSQVNEREENIDQLKAKVYTAFGDGMTLSDFLIEEALVSDVDSLEGQTDKITLLTLHAAKGLEFPVVFIAGVEEGLLPHSRSMDDPEAIEEERRLFYVGITRAKDRVYLSYAFRRMHFGSTDERAPSEFLDDIPMTVVDTPPPTLTDSADRYQKMTSWNPTPIPTKLSQAPESSPADGGNHKQNENIRSKIIPFPGGQSTQYREGMHVHHPIFGEGTVIQSKHLGSNDEEVTINFSNPQYGNKTLIASLANLTILE